MDNGYLLKNIFIQRLFTYMSDRICSRNTEHFKRIQSV